MIILSLGIEEKALIQSKNVELVSHVWLEEFLEAKKIPENEIFYFRFVLLVYIPFKFIFVSEKNE